MLQDIYRQQYGQTEAQLEAEGWRAAGELREQLASGQQEPATYIHLAKQLRGLKGYDEALAVLRQGCERVPTAGLYIEYIDFLEDYNRTEEAIEAAAEALRLFPTSMPLLLREASVLPIVYDDPGQIEYYRTRCSNRLRELDAGLKLDTPEQREDAFAAIRRHVNFYLGYQMKDDLDLQQQYARFMYRIIAARYPDLVASPAAPTAARNGRIRIGYISTQFRYLQSAAKHSVSKLFAGWISNRNSDRFEVFAYKPASSPDAAPEERPEGCEHFRHLSGDLPEVCSRIRADDLHAVIFLDVGMDSRMALLSCLRLAPVQCVAWGHPITTGSPNVDFFLSSALMEPEDGDEHYSERLIRFPGVGVFYTKPIIPRAILDRRRSRFSLRDDSVVYLCCQSTFKYVPEHDDVFVRIAQRVPASQFVFLSRNTDQARAFRKRLDRAFSRVGLTAKEHCVVLPRTDIFDYWALNLTSDIYLDSLDWSGFNTTVEAMACGLPVVTLPGRFMRGRHTYAILTQLGMPEMIAKDKEDYVDIAVRLGLDPGWRKQVVQRIAERESRLYSDRSSVIALEQFLSEVVGETAGRVQA